MRLKAVILFVCMCLCCYCVQMGISSDTGKFRNISMGQGQEKPAEAAISEFARDGGWLMLQNVHLMQSWLPVCVRA